MEVSVLFEDNHLIAVNKRASQIVQGDKTGDTPLSDFVKNYIGKKYNKPGDVFLGTIHRLDRPVSGVVLFARTSKALARMNEMFKTREVKKTYWAVVEKMPPKKEDRLELFLVKNEKLNKSFVSAAGKQGSLKCILSYRHLASSDRYHLLEIDPETGRHHQIRVMLSSIGCIIKGDLKYGAKRSNPDASIHLHARKLEFIHPVKKEPVEIIAPVPDEPLWNFFEKELSE